MSDFSIDHIVKKALRHMEQNPPQSDIPNFDDLEWDNESAFDTSIKESLSNLDSIPVESADWEDFLDENAEKLDHSHSVDEIVKSKIADTSSLFQPTGWDRFVQTLELHERRLKIVGGAKIIELLILLLIFWIGFPTQHLQDNSGITEQIQEKNTKKGALAAQSTIPNLSSEDASGDIAPSNQFIAPKSEDNTRTSSTYSEGSALQTQMDRESSTSSLQQESIAESLQNEGKLLLPQQALDVNYNNSPLFASDSDKTNKSQEEFPNHDNNIRKGEMADLLPSLPLYQLKLLALPALQPLDTSGIFGDAVAKTDVSHRPYKQTLGLVGAWNLNRVRTSADPVYPVGARTQLDRNLYIGIEWEERTGNNAFGLHGGYQQWHYLAPQYNEIFQSQGALDLQFIRLEDLRFDVLTFGIFARKYLQTSSKWEFFLHFGGGMQLALNSTYRIRSGEIADINIDRSDLSPEEIAMLPEIPKLWEKTFQEGVFQGGSINENSFMTLNLGGGVIRQLSNKWIIQFSPMMNISPFSDGLGPNRDKIQTLSFQFHLRGIIQ